MNSHDVRYLRVCDRCVELGDARQMVWTVTTGAKHQSFFHGRCALVAMGGVEGLLTLPLAQLKQLTLGDIGPDVMRALLAKIRDG